MRTLPLITLTLAPLFGCSEYEYNERVVTDVFHQPVDESKSDVLFVIDNSASMGEEQERLASNFAAFTDILLSSTTDFRLGVITTDPGEGGQMRGAWLDADTASLEEAFSAAVSVGTSGDRDERGMEVASLAVDASVNPGFLRSDAALNVVFFSDEDDHSPNAVADYLDLLYSRAGRGGFAAHAIVGDLPDGCVAGSIAADPSSRYIEAALLTGGFRDSICAPDYTDILARIGLGVSGLLDTFELSRLPDNTTLRVWVDNVEMPQREVDGWTYSHGDNAVVFHGRAVPRSGMEVLVEYELILGPAAED